MVDFSRCRRMAGLLIVLSYQHRPGHWCLQDLPPAPPSTGYTSWIYANQAALKTGRNWSPSLSIVSAIPLRRSCHTFSAMPMTIRVCTNNIIFYNNEDKSNNSNNYPVSTLISFESHVPVKFIDEVYESLVESIEWLGGGCFQWCTAGNRCKS